MPPLPFSTPKAAAKSVNGSLESALAFRRCGFLWAQHMDFSIVEEIRRLHPGLFVRPIIVLRHPVLLEPCVGSGEYRALGACACEQREGGGAPLCSASA